MHTLVVQITDEQHATIGRELGRRQSAEPTKRVTLSDIVRDALDAAPWVKAADVPASEQVEAPVYAADGTALRVPPDKIVKQGRGWD